LIQTSLKEYWAGDKGYRDNIESIVTTMLDSALASAVKNNLNAVIDNTHLNPKYITSILKTCRDNCGEEGFSYLIKMFHLSVDDCVERDKNREDSVGEEVIRRQSEQFKRCKYPGQNRWVEDISYKFESLEIDITKPKCVICDIDNTVAQMVGRSPFDESRVGEDLPKQQVIDIVKKCTDDKKWKLIFVSGRKDSCGHQTAKWIEENLAIPYDETELYMRRHNDNRRDDIIKYEILRDNILPNYNPIAVFDDRIGPTRMWRKMGLTVFQVDEGNF
jgi:predicted kinase